MKKVMTIVAFACASWFVLAADDPPSPGGYSAAGFPKPYSAPCTERENVFEFTEKPAVKSLGNDKYEITFAVKGNCDVAVGVIDAEGKVVRHLGSGVLGANAPAPFQKNSLKQTIYWNGKDDLDEYHKEPGKLKVRVMLGLKPEFDKLLLGKSPSNLSRQVLGIAIGPDGAYVFSKSSHMSCRKFDHDGGYVMSLLPPPANLPPEKLGGLGFIEYEPGIRALHGRPVNGTIHDRGYVFVTTDAESVSLYQPVLLGRKLHFIGADGGREDKAFYLHRMNTDGSTDAQEISTPFGRMSGHNTNFRMAASPDGQWLYSVVGSMVNNSGVMSFGFGTAVLRMPLAGGQPAKAFIGDPRAPGSDNQHFQVASGLDCDAIGRLYVCDRGNNRIQMFSAEGKHLKTVPVDRPDLVRVHPKTGALYVIHQARVEGKSVSRLTKFTSFDAPVEEWHADNVGGQALAVDAWTAKTRLWVGTGGGLAIYEEDGKKLNKVVDLKEQAKKEEGGNYIGQWGGSGEQGDKVVCDPVREQVYFMNRHVFDLKTGALHRSVTLIADDIAFDKRGYLHTHFNPSYLPGVARLDPERAFREVPYDYGEDKTGPWDSKWLGILPCRDQLGAKFFQDGVGVNMGGDVAVDSNIYYIPKMDDLTLQSGWGDRREGDTWGGIQREACAPNSFATWLRKKADMEKRGEEIYFLQRSPGNPLSGATIWTFDRNGELRDECAVTAGRLINGVMIDEDGSLYFANNRTRLINGKPFLAGKGGTFGAPGDKRGADPFTGTLIKTARKAKILSTAALIPLEERPARPPELSQYREEAWCEGAEWMYAGASPIVPGGCSCPTQRLHLDWYKRTFVPEAYRHSFGVVDTAGNLITHFGTYGNYDSGFGAKSKIPVGGDNIAMYMPRFISGTDNYLVFSDWGERLVALKITYQAEETVGIGNQ